jgi:hypothetical protein
MEAMARFHVVPRLMSFRRVFRLGPREKSPRGFFVIHSICLRRVKKIKNKKKENTRQWGG